LDTYDREIERYGGSEGIRVAEQIFAVDSACVLDLLSTEHSHTEWWRIALLGVDMLLADFHLLERLYESDLARRRLATT
jgi:thiopeptide-type bacteriocin biosynthesis protein